VLAVAAQLDRLSFLFAVLAAVFPMRGALLNHAGTGGVRALCGVSHGESPEKNLLLI
jgi:hypothetical protein